MSREDGCPGLSANTVRKHHNLLHTALGQAVKWRLLRENPAAFVEPPPIEKYDAAVLPDPDAIRALYEASRGTMLYIPVLLATTCGLRRGEICGLRWQDINWETGRIYVRHSLERVTGAGLHIKETKNRKGRPVAVPRTVLELLKREYLTRYEGESITRHGNDFVCAWSDGRPVAPDYITHEFEKLAKKLNLNVTFHGLRHTHNTILLRYNINPKLVAERSGQHIKLAMDLYSHVLPDMQDGIAQLLDQVLFTPKDGGEK